MLTGERTLDEFLSDYRIKTTTLESYDVSAQRQYNQVTISLEQRRKRPVGYFTRGLIPYYAPTDNLNAFVNGTTSGVSSDILRFLSGMTHLGSLGLQMLYDLNEVSNSEYGTIGYRKGSVNMYGGFKPMFEQSSILSQYPVFYSITGGNDPYPISSFTGVTEKGSSAGCYTMVNFNGQLTAFQLMFDASTIGISNNNGLPTGTAGNPLNFAYPLFQGITTAIKSLYFTPEVHSSLIRNLSLLGTWGMTFAGIIARFNPHYQFIKFADDDFLDTQTNLMALYTGSSANPAWTVELLKFAGSTALNYNSVGYNLGNNYLNAFMRDISLYPIKYNMTRNSWNVGHLGVPYVTEVLGWSALIPTPGTAIDATGPYAPIGDFFVTRLAGLTFYPAPSGYTYSSGASGWNTYRGALGATTPYHNDYFMLGGTGSAASATYAASKILPANLLTYYNDGISKRGPDGRTMDFLHSYYNDLYRETLKYGGYQYANLFPVRFVPRSNPLNPIQTTGSYSNRNTAARRDCTIHQDFGNSATERRYNLKESMAATIQASTKMWKLMLDNVGKYNYRIMYAIQGRSEDLDLTRGGSVPYSPADFVDYLIAPLFTGDVPANGFILNDDVNDRLLNDFYYGNLGRSAAEYTAVVTNRGVSGASIPTAFIRGLETYLFDLEQLQHNMTFPSYLVDLGLTAASDHFASYTNTFNSGRFSDYRVFESNVGLTGGNTVIPYGMTGTFRWYLVPLRTGSILETNTDLRSRWISDTNSSIDVAYRIIRDAYFELTKQQLAAAYQYFEDNDITTFVEYRSTDQPIGR